MSDETDHVCPTCGADHLETRRTLKIHHSRSHGKRLVDLSTCDHCGKEFEPTNKGVYCSLECRGAASRKRVTLECEHCADSFEVHQSRADEARFCSHDCRAAFQRKRTTIACDHCGEEFEAKAYASDERRYCSIQCSTRSRRNRILLECEQCGRSFRVHPSSADQKYCCHNCQFEAARKTSREFETIDELLRQLYVDEDRNIIATFQRHRAVVGEEDALTKKEARQRLIDMDVYGNRHQRMAIAANPDETGGPGPEGDDSWREYYEGSADD